MLPYPFSLISLQVAQPSCPVSVTIFPTVHRYPENPVSILQSYLQPLNNMYPVSQIAVLLSPTRGRVLLQMTDSKTLPRHPPIPVTTVGSSLRSDEHTMPYLHPPAECVPLRLPSVPADSSETSATVTGSDAIYLFHMVQSGYSPDYVSALLYFLHIAEEPPTRTMSVYILPPYPYSPDPETDSLTSEIDHLLVQPALIPYILPLSMRIIFPDQF